MRIQIEIRGDAIIVTGTNGGMPFREDRNLGANSTTAEIAVVRTLDAIKRRIGNVLGYNAPPPEEAAEE